MIMKKKVFDIFIWTVTVFFVLGIFFLPNEVPLHWNINWEIDRYGSRYELLIIVLMPIIIYYGMLLTKKIDPKLKSIKKREKTYELIRKLISFFCVLLVIFFYFLIIYPIHNATFIICLLLGGLLIFIGNYMPKFPQSYFLGIRTPWTLANETVWIQTHRIGGYLYMLGGIVIILGGLFSPVVGSRVLIVSILIVILLTTFYSYIEYKRLTK